MDEAETVGYNIEEGRKGDSTQVEFHHGNTTAGRRLGGANAGATARFDTWSRYTYWNHYGGRQGRMEHKNSEALDINGEREIPSGTYFASWYLGVGFWQRQLAIMEYPTYDPQRKDFEVTCCFESCMEHEDEQVKDN